MGNFSYSFQKRKSDKMVYKGWVSERDQDRESADGEMRITTLYILCISIWVMVMADL